MSEEGKYEVPGGLYDKLREAAAQMQNTFYEPPKLWYIEQLKKAYASSGYIKGIQNFNMVKRLKRKRERSLLGLCKRYGLPSLLLNPTHRNT